MKRRTFNKSIALLGVQAAFHPLRAAGPGESPMQRIGSSTVTFRNRFAGTRPENAGDTSEELTLHMIPEYFADRFGLHNVEFWSKHFESLEDTYLAELKSRIRKSKSALINIQFDEAYQLGSVDPAERTESLKLALRWVEVADKLGSGAIRVNPGNGDLQHAIEALRIINQAAVKKGIILMIENHFGIEMDPDVHLQIIREVGENTYSLPDFGNYPDETRYEALRRIMPFAYQISAKTVDFDDQMQHLSFDFDRCMQIVTDSGFSGIYSVEQWSRNPASASDEEITDWMIDKVKPYCR